MTLNKCTKKSNPNFPKNGKKIYVYPKIVRILIKKLSQNRHNFDEILTFLGKFLRGRVLRRT